MTHADPQSNHESWLPDLIGAALFVAIFVLVAAGCSEPVAYSHELPGPIPPPPSRPQRAAGRTLPPVWQGPFREAVVCEWADGDEGVLACHYIHTNDNRRFEIWISPKLRTWRVRGIGVGQRPMYHCIVRSVIEQRRYYEYGPLRREVNEVCGDLPYALFVCLSSPTKNAEDAAALIRDGEGVFLRELPDLVSSDEWNAPCEE